jgi:hypothetical protein
MVVGRLETGFEGVDPGRWLTGAVAGAVGAVVGSLVLYVTGSFDPSAVGVEALGVLFVPGAVFGLLYAGIVGFGRLAALAATPRTGALLGLAYGFLFGLTTLVGGSTDTSTLLAGVAFGCVIGVLFALSPYTR